jgi:cellulose synthase/poly-beta-1,6-N-acetylglucosamine synthase-like glycosyltransferase
MFVAYNSAKLHSMTNWLLKYTKETGTLDGEDTRHDLPFNHVIHNIILPNYKEEMETLCETLDVLASHSRALSQYKICLAMEESEPNAVQKAQSLIKMYADSFYQITYSLHPINRPGEIRGKSSNVAWAAFDLASKSGGGLNGRHAHEILTVMDADTCFAEDYFAAINYHYCVASPEQRKIMMFAPSTVFDRYTYPT